MQSFQKLFNEHVTFPLRWKYLVDHLSPYLKDVNNVLDLGASCGRLAYKLSERLPQINFVGIDTYVQPKIYIPVKEYNGTNIPYPDNYFDCVMMVDVIHHIENPEIVLNEAKRVSKKYLLIKDHYWKNKFDHFLLKLADYNGNKPYGVDLPYNFLKVDDWNDLFKDHNLRTIATEKFRCNIIDPCRHIIFKLEK